MVASSVPCLRGPATVAWLSLLLLATSTPGVLTSGVDSMPRSLVRSGALPLKGSSTAADRTLVEVGGVGDALCNVPGFFLKPNQGVQGTDYNCGTMGTLSLADLGRKCIADPRCSAFEVFLQINDTAQYYCLKTITAPTTPFPASARGLCTGLYVRTAGIACPSVLGFSPLQQGQDVPDNDIQCNEMGTIDSVLSVARMCREDASCKAFTTFFNVAEGREYYCLKSAAGPITQEGLVGVCAGLWTKTDEEACPPAPGYCFQRDQDVSGSDISCSPMGSMTVAAVAQICNVNPDCVSFVTFYYRNAVGGYFCLKSSTGPAQQLPDGTVGACTGLWTKDADVACPGLPGFAFSRDKDTTASNIVCATMAGASRGDVAQVCSADPRCTSFVTFYNPTTSQDMYCLKNSSTGTTKFLADGTWGYCTGLHTKIAEVAACPSIPGFCYQRDQDAPGSDYSCSNMGNRSTADVAQTCREAPSCTGFLYYYNSADRQFYYCLKASLNALTRLAPGSMGRCTGLWTKNEGPGCPSIPGFTLQKHQDVQVPDSNIACGNAVTAQLAADSCTASGECKAFVMFHNPGQAQQMFCTKSVARPVTRLPDGFIGRCTGLYISDARVIKTGGR